MKSLFKNWKAFCLMGVLAMSSIAVGRAQESATATPDSPDELALEEPTEKRLFPLFMDRLRLKEKQSMLPPPYGIMGITNWMDSDWEFTSASVSLGDSPYIDIPAAEKATMDLKSSATGIKADVWILPFLDFMIGGGSIDVDADLGLVDIPIGYSPIGGVVRGDKIVPMDFGGKYYSIGFVIAGAYKRFYGAIDASWVKTELDGDASLSEEGFWTLTVSPKVGYNAGTTQFFVGARYISKNEHFVGTVPLASGQTLGFDVTVETATWSPIFGIRTIIRNHWELLMESSLGVRHQITGGVGYRW
jgi:hypothetical protein